MTRAGREEHKLEAALVHPVGDEGDWDAAGVPSDEQGTIFIL